jgi:DNA-binding CsgD family transcriptional regulator
MSSSAPNGRFAFQTPFVGRGRELAELSAALDRALAGRGQMVLLAGEPGIGKTRTAAELAGIAEERGCRVLWGRCYEWEGAPAYWPWVQLLRGYLASVDDDRLRADLGSGAADIAQIAPEIGARLPDLAPLPPMEPEQARFRLFDALATFFANAARDKPLVLVLDDLHWADRPSMLLLEFIAQGIERARVLLVGTFRDVEVSRQHPLTATLAELARQPHGRRVALRGLARDDVSIFIERLIDRETPPALVDAIFAETEGNPFFTAEVVRLLAAEGRLNPPLRVPFGQIGVPESVREAIGRRLDRLSAECNRILSIGAVIGREFSLALLERVSREPAGELLAVLDESLAARLIETLDPPAQFRFSHALVQETVYTGLGVLQRLRLHASVGEALEQLHAADLEPYAADLAHHFFQAASLGMAGEAVRYTLMAARRAEAQLAWESAISQYERTLQALELREPRDERRRCEVLLALGEAQNRAGTGGGRVIGAGYSPVAAETFMAAARAARAVGLPEHFARAAFGIIGLSMSVAQGGIDASELLKEALAALPRIDSVLHAHLLAGYAVHRLTLLAIDKLPFDPVEDVEIRSLADEAVAMARRLGDPGTLAYTLHARCRVYSGPDDLDGQFADAEEAVVAATAAGDPRLLVMALFTKHEAALYRADFEAARDVLNRLQWAASPLKIRYFDYIVTVCKAGHALREGRFGDAEHHIADALTSWPGVGRSIWQLLALRREQARASEVADRIRWIFEQGPNVTLWRAMWVWALLETGQVDEARALFTSIPLSKLPIVPREWTTRLHALYAEFCAVLDDQERAAVVYDCLLPYANRHVFGINSDHTGGAAAYYLGLLATTLKRWDEAERHFGDALAMNERWEFLPYVAYTRYAWAEMLTRRGDPGDRERARTFLDLALAGAREIGMLRLARLVETLAARMAPDQASSRRELSARELDVLRLLVDGRTNQEIAQALSISHHTAANHVANIMSKLGLESRTAAAAWAVRHGIV